MPSSAPNDNVVTVDLGDRSYDVHLGAGVRARLGSAIPAGARRAAVITQTNVGWAVDSGLDQSVLEVPDGEEAKSLAEVERLCRVLSAAGFTRSDVIVAVGGGVVTDLAGLCGRGLPPRHPLRVGAHDAAGPGGCGHRGKDRRKPGGGKNLVGAFWQPHAVLCDTDVLATLPPREMLSGQGELAKYHFLTGDDLDALDLGERIAAAVRIKAAVVAADEREGGRRAILNYGHTLAHAVETAGRYDLRHGEAVAVGLVYAAEVAVRMGRIDEDRVAEHRRVVTGYGLPSRLPAMLDEDELLALFGRDKKAIDGVTLVLDSARGVEPVAGVPDPVLRDALAAIR